MYDTLISVNALSQLINDSNDLVIVDCRFSLANHNWGKDAYLNGHIPGAVYAHLNIDLSDPVEIGKTGRHPLPDRGRFIQWVRNAGITNHTQVIAYDQGGGGYAARLWWLMRWIGHDAVAVLDGGWASWVKHEMPVDTHIQELKESEFNVSMREDLAIGTDVVSAWAHDPGHHVVDSREARRYAGIEEPIDPVAGHIPGAINKPYGENLTSDGQWRSQEELRQRFAALLDTTGCENIVFYCGSGVTACHNILAFKYAGLGDARLYPGSWSEWITDQRREIAFDD
jgi:thiosulfate/3-mercaptopyruvate sulfurtransferase